MHHLSFSWEHGGPKEYQIAFSRFNGDQFEWKTVSSKKNMPHRIDEEVTIGDVGSGLITGAVRLVLTQLGEYKQYGLRSCFIMGVPAAVAIQSILASSNYSGAYSASKLLEGGVWSSKAEAKLPVSIEFKLSGRYHVRKLHYHWKSDGPVDFDTHFSEDGELWYRVDTKQGLPPRQHEAVIIGDPGYHRSTGFIKLELFSLQPGHKYFGLEEVGIQGDLDLAWRTEAMSRLEENLGSPSSRVPQGDSQSSPLAVTPARMSVAPSPRHSSPQRVRELPPPSPVYRNSPMKMSAFGTESAAPFTGGNAAATASISFASSAASLKDAEIARLRDENTRLKAEMSDLKAKFNKMQAFMQNMGNA